MGKKRIAVIGEEISNKKKNAGLPDEARKKRAKSGKVHGNVTDMGAIALEEAAEIEKKESAFAIASEDKGKKLVLSEVEGSVKSAKTKKIRSKRFLTIKKQVDRAKLYPLNEAISLVKKTSIAKFKGGVELHLVLKEAGLKKEITLPYPLNKDKEKITVATEKKAPLIHLVIGKLEMTDERLAANFQTIIRAVGPKNIKKAVLCATMGPGIKIKLN